MFPALSLTHIFISSWFSVYSLLPSFCHVNPPSKLYASSSSPDRLSFAIISITTASFVSSSGVFVILSIFGASLSKYNTCTFW